MAYPKGAPKPPNSGRQLGTRNKATKEINDLLQSMECDPIEGMVRIAQGDVDCGVCHGTGRTKYQPAKGKDKLAERTCESCYGSGKERISPELKGKMLGEIAKYHRPMRKAIEHTVEAKISLADVIRERRKRLNGGDGGS